MLSKAVIAGQHIELDHSKRGVKRIRDLDLERIRCGQLSEAEVLAVLPAQGDGVRIAHFADLHGEAGQLEKIGKVTRMLRAAGELGLCTMGGDLVEGAQDVALLKEMIRMLNTAGVDAATLGNHEFDCHDQKDLKAGAVELRRLISEAPGTAAGEEFERRLSLQEESLRSRGSPLASALNAAEFPLVCANLEFESGSEFFGLESGGAILPHVVKEINGHRVLLIGLAPPELQYNFDYHRRCGFDSSVSVNPKNPRELVLAEIGRVKEQYQDRPLVTVLLSHCGLKWDTNELAHPEVDLILGAHTHNEVHRVVEFEGGHRTHILHGGQNGENLIFADLEFTAQGRLGNVRQRLLEIPEIVPGAEGLFPERRILMTDLGENLGFSSHELSLRGKSAGSTDLMRFITDAVKEEAGADFGMMVPGVVRAGIPPGEIRSGALAKIFPWDEKLHVVTVKGALISEMIESALERSRVESGRTPLLLHFAGLRYSVDREGKLESVETGESFEERLDPEREYRLACTEFMLSGLGGEFPLTELARVHPERVRALPLSIRDAVAGQIRSGALENGRPPEPRIHIDPEAPLLYNDRTVIY